MASKAMPLRLGPFTGGLSTYSDASTIGETDCAYLNNFDIDLNGSLVSRPPITKVAQNVTAGNSDQRILGQYTTSAGVSYIMLATNNKLTTNYLIAYNIATNTYAIVTSGITVKFTAMVKYLTKAYFICDPGAAYTGAGGWWDGTTWTNVVAMAHGVSACIYKERIFVAYGKDSANPGRVSFSGPSGTIETWNAGADFFDANNGDGQPIVKVYGYNGTVAIFKTNSTYNFAYDSQPVKGQVQTVSSTIGIDGGDCLTESENVVYVMHNSRLYGITNWSWEHLNIKVPFAYTNSHTGLSNRNVSVSMIGSRVVCRYYDTLYVYGSKTRVFTTWSPNTSLAPDFWVRSPIKDVISGVYTYFAGNYLTDLSVASQDYIFKFKDTYTSIDAESMLCEFRSKIYDTISYTSRSKSYVIKMPYTYKRLLWWGVDLLANSVVNASVLPVAYGVPVKWLDITSRNLTWLSRRQYTWGNPLILSIRVDDVADIKNLTGIRTFVRYVKSLRYRQIQFILKSTVDGSTNSGPFSIFSIIAFVSNKETVNTKVS